MITKVKGIGFTIGKGTAGKGISNPEAISFKKAEVDGHKAIRVLDLTIVKDNGDVRIAKLSLRQAYNLVTNTDCKQLAGVKDLPKSAEETDLAGAKKFAQWLIANMPDLKEMVANGQLVCEYSLKDEDGIGADGKPYVFEKANISAIYATSAETSANLVAKHSNYAFEA